MKRLTGTVGLILGMMAPLAAMAQPSPTVIELFTSQGCSSCPPAEALLGELAGRPDVVTLAYHVDYWDYLGWKDPYSLSAATERQRLYARALSLASIYTPQMVINGHQDVVGSDRATVSKALTIKQEGIPVEITQDADKITVHLPAQAQALPSDVVVVAYSPQAETTIPRGENAGRTLKQASIVRGIYPLGSWDGKDSTLVLDRTKIHAEAPMIAVLVQTPRQGPILGAALLSLR